MTSKILENIEAISRKVDNNGWTPLHLAAYFDYANIANLLLDKDREVAYMKDTEGRTALHIAAKHSNILIIKSIVSRCPDCCELVDNRGWNVLHFAMKADYVYLEDMIKFIIKNSSLSNLWNEKNAAGDTPLHYYANSSESASNFLQDTRVNHMAFNKQNPGMFNIDAAKLSREKRLEIMNAIHPPPRRVITHEDEDKKDKDGDKKKEEETVNAIHPPPRRVITYEDEDKKDKDGDKKKEEERSLMLQKAGEAHLVVAALITTVTFAAGITMPGGFASGGEGSHPGSALLRRNAAFKAFVITDAISMVFSSVAVFIHLLTPVFLNNNCDKEMHFTLVSLAFNLIVLAMLAMGLAFATGTYAVLEPSLGLAIPNLILGLTFLYILSFVFLSVLQRRRRKPGDH